MRIIISVFLLLCSSLVFCQQEASVWYFGENAGLKFENDGTVTPLDDGLLNTNEGCSSIADDNGNLLFYTDGRTVWDKNHVRMPNGDFLAGTELFGDASSTQSGIIVPKPGNPNIYYIFTVDEPHHSNAAVYPNQYFGSYPDYANDGSVPTTDDGFNNGFNYSIVDLSVTGSNGSIGDVVSRNNHLITYNTDAAGEEIKYKCSEKVTAIKNEITNEYWVITQFINKFYSFKITSSGVISSPVITTIGPSITLAGYRRNAMGYLKSSPNGDLLAIAHGQNGTIAGDANFNTGSVLTYSFDKNTGIVSNQQTAITGVIAYGVEFSPDSNKLYANYRPGATAYMALAQFDLLAADLAASKVIIENNSNYLYALQLGINNKIYVATSYSNSLGVINNPNASGLLCDYAIVGQLLSTGKKVKLGLPPFISSFFNVAILTSDVCEGSNTLFTLNTPSTPSSVVWDFGDGTTSTAINPNHTYSSAGTYTVSVTVTSIGGTATNTKNVTIYPLPTLLANTVSLKQCDDDADGFSAFNLQESTSLLVSSPTGLTFSYFATALNAQNNSNAITNLSTYTNQIVSNDMVFVRVQNANGCYRVAQLNLIVSTTLIPNSFQKVYTECDSAASGSTTDGLALFDFSAATADIQNLFPSGQLLTITFYKNSADALAETNAITNTSSYTNTGYPNSQNIYVRVDSQLNNECLGLGHHITLVVDRIPIVQPQTLLHCDDDENGVYGFDTSTLQSDLLNGLTNVLVTYTDQNGNALLSPLPNPFFTTSQVVTVNVKNNYGKQCYYNSTITFVVDDLPQAFLLPANITTTCSLQSTASFDTSTFESIILGGQTGMVVNYFDGSNTPLPSPLPNPFVTTQQNVSVEVINASNGNCVANLTIPFVVNPIPVINLIGNELVCSNNPNFTKVIDAGLVNPSDSANYTYEWFLNGSLIANATQYSLTINTEGLYEVNVKNSYGCVATRQITVNASNVAVINSVDVTDLTTENSMVVFASGLGDYMYSLDNEMYQDSNTFNNLMPGIYTVYVKDKNGCGISTNEVSVLGIPNYFSPNNDGYNDYWNLVGASATFYSNTKIYLYDRFGKLLKQISAISDGWDGTYLGQPLSSDDYWYCIAFETGRIVKGHFTLKR